MFQVGTYKHMTLFVPGTTSIWTKKLRFWEDIKRPGENLCVKFQSKFQQIQSCQNSRWRKSIHFLLRMVNKCIVSGCKSGYSNTSPTQREDPEKNKRKLYFPNFPMIWLFVIFGLAWYQKTLIPPGSVQPIQEFAQGISIWRTMRSIWWISKPLGSKAGVMAYACVYSLSALHILLNLKTYIRRLIFLEVIQEGQQKILDFNLRSTSFLIRNQLLL